MRFKIPREGAQSGGTEKLKCPRPIMVKGMLVMDMGSHYQICIRDNAVASMTADCKACGRVNTTRSGKALERSIGDYHA